MSTHKFNVSKALGCTSHKIRQPLNWETSEFRWWMTIMPVCYPDSRFLKISPRLGFDRVCNCGSPRKWVATEVFFTKWQHLQDAYGLSYSSVPGCVVSWVYLDFRRIVYALELRQRTSNFHRPVSCSNDSEEFIYEVVEDTRGVCWDRRDLMLRLKSAYVAD
jgi:hypothetical protein